MPTKTPRITIKRTGWLAFAALALAVYLVNASWLVNTPEGAPVLLAHRGAGQAYNRTGLTNETCTAARLIPTGHDYLENTLPSMAAAFEFGADVVEFDVQLTRDNKFAVFHDAVLDCRTEISGVIRDFALDSLQALDVGFGYTADGGQTYPFRGTGTGMMPSLEQVLSEFPGRRFLIDIKSRNPLVGELLADQIAELPGDHQSRLMVYGGGVPVAVVRDRLPNVSTIWAGRLKQCLLRYAAVGWTGLVPRACRNSPIMVPANAAPWLWGWPNRFTDRMHRAGSDVFLLGDYAGEGFSTPFDDPERAQALAPTYRGGIWTDRIDLLGPLFKHQLTE